MALVRRLSVVFVAALALSACSGEDQRTAVDVPAQGDPSGPQPVDIFRAEQLGLLDYAQLVVRNRCLAEAGYPQNRDGMVEYGAAVNHLRFSPRNLLGFTSEDEARDSGFGQDAPPQPARIVSYDPNYDAALEECESHAWEDLGADAQQVYLSYHDLGNQITSIVAGRMRPVAAETVTALIDCLEAAGFEYSGDREGVGLLDIPSRFVPLGHYDGPSSVWEPNQIAGTVQVGEALPAREWIPSPQETDLAVAVFRCDQQSHRMDRLWDAHYAGQVEAVTQLESTFAELNPKLDRLAGQAATIVAST